MLIGAAIVIVLLVVVLVLLLCEEWIRDWLGRR